MLSHPSANDPDFMRVLSETQAMTSASAPSIRRYFVDEAGDDTLFDCKNSSTRVIIGSKGGSRFFILELVDILDLIWGSTQIPNSLLLQTGDIHVILSDRLPPARRR